MSQANTISSPYNFVPLNTNVHYPEWQNISHDLPHEKGICGEIEIEIENLSDLIIGDAKDASLEYQPCFKVDGKPAIPGTSLKGLIRSIIEPATASLIELNNERFAQRNLTSATNDYMKVMKVNQTGWLYWNQVSHHWYIKPTKAKYKTIRHNSRTNHNEKTTNTDVQETLEDLFKQCKNKIERIETAKDRYENIHQAYPAIARKNACVKVISDKYLVISNQLEGSKKAREFLFSDPTDEILKVPEKVMQEFLYVTSKKQTEVANEHWNYLKERVEEGIPVFFNSANKTITSFGLTKLYRLPYKNEIVDLLPMSYKKDNGAMLDFASLLFGTIKDTDIKDNKARKGRLNIGLAQMNQNAQFKTYQKKLLLSNPNASFYPAYITQPKITSSDKEYKNYDSNGVISGFKKYFLHKSLKESNFPVDKKGNENTGVSKYVEVLKSGVKFKSKIRFHNILSEELGAIIWAITFNENPNETNYYHSLGMGKPLGYGKTKLKISGMNIIANNGFEPIEQSDYIGAFLDYLTNHDLLNDKLAALKSMYRSEHKHDSELNYLVLDPAKEIDQFKDAKKAGCQLTSLDYSTELSEIEAFQKGQEKLKQEQEQARKANLSPTDKLIESINNPPEQNANEFFKELLESAENTVLSASDKQKVSDAIKQTDWFKVKNTKKKKERKIMLKIYVNV